MKNKTLYLFGVIFLLLPFSGYLLPALLSAALSFGPTDSAVTGLWMHSHGKATDCGPLESIRAISQRRAINEGISAITQQSRIVESARAEDLWDSPMGRFWVSRGAYMPEFFGTIAEQDQDIYGLSKLAPGSVVLDCGANYGITVRKALNAGAGKVVAIEPDPDIVACLRRTFASEIRAGRVIVYPKGVWDRDDVLTLHRSQTQPWGDSFIGQDTSLDVQAPLTTIDHLVSELGLSRVDFIKMDIEGAEPKAIAGASDTIRRFHPRIAACVYHNSGDRAAVESKLPAGYSEQCACKEWHGKIIRDVALLR